VNISSATDPQLAPELDVTVRLTHRRGWRDRTCAAGVQTFMPAPRALGLRSHLGAELDHVDAWTVPYADKPRSAGIQPAPRPEQAAGEAPASRANGRAVPGGWLRSLRA
jgi:hypothetical protein